MEKNDGAFIRNDSILLPGQAYDCREQVKCRTVATGGMPYAGSMVLTESASVDAAPALAIMQRAVGQILNAERMMLSMNELYPAPLRPMVRDMEAMSQNVAELFLSAANQALHTQRVLRDRWTAALLSGVSAVVKPVTPKPAEEAVQATAAAASDQTEDETADEGLGDAADDAGDDMDGSSDAVTDDIAEEITREAQEAAEEARPAPALAAATAFAARAATAAA